MNIPSLIRPVVWALLVSLVVACSNMPPERESRAEFVEQQKNFAQSLRSEGRLADSRSLWLTLLTLDASDSQAIEVVAQLDQAIARRVEDAWRKGESAYSRGNTRDGDIWMLRVLAAQPGHEAAQQRLAKSQSASAQSQQRDKSLAENRILLARKREAPGGVNEKIKAFYREGAYQQVLDSASQISGVAGSEVGDLVRKSHIALADEEEAQGDWKLALSHVQGAIASDPIAHDPLLSRAASLRGQLSDSLYKEGLMLMSDDLTAAIDVLKNSLFYNPYNQSAKRKLQQAQKLEANLRRIQGK